jgi:HEAT repeat protein
VRALTALSTNHAVPVLARRLVSDVHPLVRAQAVEWLSNFPSPSVAALIVDRMVDSAAVVRFAAQDAARNTGEAVVQPLLRLLCTRSGEDCHAALNAVKGLASPAFLPAVLALTHDPHVETRALATGTLGILGGAESISQLQRALQDRSAAVRAAATHAIGQLAHWPAAPALAMLLSDSHFGVRREAATALRRLGAPGMLLLRNASTGPNAAASNIARHVMSLPDPVFRNRAAA